MPTTRRGSKIGAASASNDALPDLIASDGTITTRSASRAAQSAARRVRKTRKRQPPFPLMRLPNDVLYEIIGFAAVVRPSKLPRNLNTMSAKSFMAYAHPFAALRLLSACNRRLRELSIPTLFRTISIRDHVVQEKGKDEILEALRHLMTKPEIHMTARYFILQTDKRDGVYHYETPTALLKCLSMMKNVEEIALRFNFNPGWMLVPMIRSHLEYGPLPEMFNKLTSISLQTQASRAEELCDVFKLCPNLQNTYVEIRCCVRHCQHLKAVAELPNLKYLMLSRLVSRPRDGDVPFGWSVEDIKQIAEIVPNIRHLALIGQLEDTKLSDYVDTFAEFKQLEQLDMTDEQVIPQELVDDVANNMFLDSDASDSEMEEMMDAMDERAIAGMEADEHWLNEDRKFVAKKFFEKVPTMNRLFLGRCGSGSLWEPQEDRSEVKVVDVCDDWDDVTDKWQYGFPRVLHLNHIHVDY